MKNKKLSDAELIEAFDKHEVAEILKPLVLENSQRLKRLKKERKLLEERLDKEYSSNSNELNRYFVLTWWDVSHKTEIKDVERLLKVQSRQYVKAKNLAPKIVNNHLKWQEKVERAKEASIVDIAQQYAEVKRAGRRFTMLCPLHEEKTPSLVLYPDSNSFHCFGCKKGGDVIQFYIELHNVPFKEAVNYLSTNF
jgi:hypothetical protein